jgi:hypothetical protein
MIMFVNQSLLTYGVGLNLQVSEKVGGFCNLDYIWIDPSTTPITTTYSIVIFVLRKISISGVLVENGWFECDERIGNSSVVFDEIDSLKFHCLIRYFVWRMMVMSVMGVDDDGDDDVDEDDEPQNEMFKLSN